jgi:hypothetical protein
MERRKLTEAVKKMQRLMKPDKPVYEALAYLPNFVKLLFKQLEEGLILMDKKIKKIEKDVKKISTMHHKNDSVKKVGKELKSLEKADKKRDKAVEVGEKMMKKKMPMKKK